MQGTLHSMTLYASWWRFFKDWNTLQYA